MKSKNSKLFTIGTAERVDIETGESVPIEGGGFKMLPGPPGTCEWCHVKHDPGLPHNKDSLSYQMAVVYAAGWFDGEGCFLLGEQNRGSVRGRQIYQRVSVGHTHRPTLTRMASLFGGQVVEFPKTWALDALESCLVDTPGADMSNSPGSSTFASEAAARRYRCHLLVEQMPDPGTVEMEAALTDMCDYYVKPFLPAKADTQAAPFPAHIAPATVRPVFPLAEE